MYYLVLFFEKIYLTLAWVTAIFSMFSKKSFIESSSLNKENVQKNFTESLLLVETNIKIYGKLQP